MTFSTLQQQTSYSDSSFTEHDLTPVGTDEDEAKRYSEIMGAPKDQVYDFTDDLYDAGLIPDESGHRYA